MQAVAFSLKGTKETDVRKFIIVLILISISGIVFAADSQNREITISGKPSTGVDSRGGQNQGTPGSNIPSKGTDSKGSAIYNIVLTSEFDHFKINLLV